MIPAIGIATPLKVYFTVFTGLLSGVLIGAATGIPRRTRFNDEKYRMARRTEPDGFDSRFGRRYVFPAPPIVIIVIAIVVSMSLTGVFGVAIAAVGMLSTLGVTLALGRTDGGGCRRHRNGDAA